MPILPIRGWLQRIGGEHVQVAVLIRSGQSMHTFDPVPRLMTELDACSVFFTLGLPFERRMVERLESRSKPPRVVDLRTGIELREIDVPCVHETDDPNHKHEHATGGDKDPHIWLNPRMAAQICSTIGQTLIDLDPAHRDEYAKNLAALQSELLAAHEKMRERLANLRGSSMLVYHPDFGYFCDEYGLRQMPLELEGREPTAREISVLTEKAKALAVGAVFTQPQYSRKSADILASRIGATVVVIDPLSEEYFDVLEQLAGGLLAHAPASRP